MDGYAERLASWLRAHADAEAAGPMADYMRGQFVFLGLKNPRRLELTKRFFAERGIPSGEALLRTALALWALPEREFQYTALLLLEKRSKEAVPEWVGLLETLIVDKSWWDTVDTIAGHLAGGLFARYPELAESYALSWIESDNMWLRRSAILFQLRYKEATDRALLFELIRRCSHEREFFIRKAIGWALREYAKTDADAVREFVADTALAPLSVREALKRIGPGATE